MRWQFWRRSLPQPLAIQPDEDQAQRIERLERETAALRMQCVAMRNSIKKAVSLLPLLEGHAKSLSGDGMQKHVSREILLCHAAIAEALTGDPQFIARMDTHKPETAEYSELSADPPPVQTC